jgi:hypothetical protein
MYDPTSPEVKAPLTPEEKKNLSHQRIYWAIVIVDALIACLFIFEIIDLFVD